MTPNYAPDNQLARRLPSWKLLNTHHKKWSSTLADLFQQDPSRGKKLNASCGELYLDYSKSHTTQETLDLLFTITKEANLEGAIHKLTHGSHVNYTEDRPALHTLLRASSPLDPTSANPKISQFQKQIHDCQKRMELLTERIREKAWLGHSGKPITHIVNIGIGGSDLGPRTVYQALNEYHHPDITVHFVANIDPSELLSNLEKLNIEDTLFIVASKSFTTQETLVNAQAARKWALEQGCPKDQLNHHFIAASSNIEKAKEFGIAEQNIFPLWDWVGGRYSLWSAIGLPIAIAIGWPEFKELLNGAEEMDDHYQTAPPEKNMPILLALINFWYSQFWGATSQAILPYSHQLRNFPTLLQQMDMESLGKSVNYSGETLNHSTGLVIWGTEESNGQHSFHQLLLQGAQRTPVDFIAIVQPNNPLKDQHTQLLSACLSQGQALMYGKNLDQAKAESLPPQPNITEHQQLAQHKVIEGDRPSNTLLLKRLTPHNLGALIALYEHKIYTLSVLFDINAFDQWGVELGKQLNQKNYDALTEGQTNESWDSSTNELIQWILSNTP